jgi:hypothetical protein
MRFTVTHARLELPHSPHSPAPVDISAHSVENIVMLGYAEHIADPERGESVSLGGSWNDPYPNGY